MAEASWWDPSSPEFHRQEQSMLDHRGLLVIPTIAARGQLVINCFTSYAFNAADVMDNDNFATVLETYVTISFLQITQVNTEKVPSFDHLVLARKWCISPEKALNIF